MLQTLRAPTARPICAGLAPVLFVTALVAAPLAAQGHGWELSENRNSRAALDSTPGLIWAGSDSVMTVERIAAYAAPILWFSPDEPNLKGRSGRDIRVPEAFPFESAPDAPVSYYMLRNLFYHQRAPGWWFRPDSAVRGQSLVNLANTDALDLDFFFYYAWETGLGAHEHDVESVQMKLVMARQPECHGCEFALFVVKVTGKAHGLEWYDHTLVVVPGMRFPMHILVEEGKHASITDKNADGFYTPGFDVNRRINDAWGLRDNMRNEWLGTGAWQSWMAKVRHPPDQVMPPLPEDSPFREQLSVEGVYAPENAVYELRPFPPYTKAAPDLVRFMDDKGDPNWPKTIEYDGSAKFLRWLEEYSFTKSLSIAYRYDGNSGVSAAFPLFIVKNFEVGITGGWLVHRIYFSGPRLQNFAWTLLYTRAASNWVGGYVSGGIEWAKVTNSSTTTTTSTDANFVGELGVKFRANVAHTPLHFMSKLTDFWGLRVGVKATDAFTIQRLDYVIEIGAGAF